MRESSFAKQLYKHSLRDKLVASFISRKLPNARDPVQERCPAEDALRAGVTSVGHTNTMKRHTLTMLGLTRQAVFVRDTIQKLCCSHTSRFTTVLSTRQRVRGCCTPKHLHQRALGGTFRALLAGLGRFQFDELPVLKQCGKERKTFSKTSRETAQGDVADPRRQALANESSTYPSMNPRHPPSDVKNRISQNVLIRWLLEVKSPTKLSTYCLLSLIQNRKLTILWGI